MIVQHGELTDKRAGMSNIDVIKDLRKLNTLFDGDRNNNGIIILSTYETWRTRHGPNNLRAHMAKIDPSIAAMSKTPPRLTGAVRGADRWLHDISAFA